MTAITDALRITGRTLRLDEIDPNSTPGFDGVKADGEQALLAHAESLSSLQEKLFADSRAGGTRSVLLVVQGMDTSGKGGIMRHVVGQVDPQGVSIKAFKAPTEEERSHDFLWRIERALPGPGMIGVFDRSHYEDVLIHRVRGLSSHEVVQERYGRIADFESSLVDRGVEIVKVMLHISREEQGARLLERLDRPDKYWKFNPGDIDERALWDEYMEAYQVAINRTARAHAPWFVVPANRKWFARLAVQQILTEALARVNPQWPGAEFDVEEQRARLIAGGYLDADALAASEAERAAAAAVHVADSDASDDGATSTSATHSKADTKAKKDKKSDKAKKGKKAKKD